MIVTIKDVVDFYSEFPEYIGELEVFTQFGYYEIEFAGISSFNSVVVSITTISDKNVLTSPEHLLFTENGWVKSENLVLTDVLNTIDGFERIQSIESLPGRRDLFDLQVATVHEFYANGFVSHNSSLIDALTFALFGKSFRKINIPQLVNTINGSDCLVTLTFQKNDKHYKIVRGLKPNVFEIYLNDVLIDQDSKKKDYQQHLEKNILGFGYKSFTQVVVLGSSSFVPFMKLTPADRRLIIEDLLEIDMFSKMNVILKQLIQDLRSEQKDLQFAENLCLDRIESHEEFEKKLQQNKTNQISEKEHEVIRYQKMLVKQEQEIEKLNNSVVKKLEKIPNQQKIQQSQNKLKELQIKISHNKRRVETERDFFTTHADCPTCQQPILQNFRDASILQRNSKLTEFENTLEQVNSAFQKSELRLNKIHEMQNYVSQLQNKIQIMNMDVSNIQNIIQNLNKEISNLQKDIHSTKDFREKLVELRQELVEIEKKKTDLDNKSRLYRVSIDLLKDSGIKSIIIKQYLPIINKLVNKYLASLNFFVNFQLSETFEETIKSRFRDEFSYDNFSEGERQRIDLSLLFAWREIARIKNSLHVNILLFDEVFDSSLDLDGTENFMSLLNQLSDDCNVFVISHTKDLLADKFDDILRFEKRQNFSNLSVKEYTGEGDVS